MNNSQSRTHYRTVYASNQKRLETGTAIGIALVLLVLAASNLDDSEFSRPEVCDFARQANRHLAFGVGVHRCLGSHLARMEIRVVLDEMLRRFESYELAFDAPVITVGHIRGVRELPAKLTAAATEGKEGGTA